PFQMNSIAIVGASHVAALRAGWGVIANEFPGLRMRFFAAPSDMMKDMVVAQNCLAPGNATLRSYIRRAAPRARIGANFDRYIVCGHGFGADRALELYRPRAMFDPSSFVDTLAAVLRETAAVDTIRKLQCITKAPIDLLARPMLAERERNLARLGGG